MNKIISFIQKKRQIRKAKKQRNQERFLQMYFSYLYQKNDAGKVEIPYFIKAKETVEDLKMRGLLTPVYNLIIKKGVA